MPSIGLQELLIVGAVVLLIFGPRRLPEVGRSVGSTLREFRAGSLGKTLEKDEEQTQVADHSESEAGKTV